MFFFQEETQMYMEEYGIPEILFYPSALLEIILPIFIIIGFKTQFCASIMVIFTISVTIIFHMDFNNQMQLIMFLKNISIFFFIFYLLPVLIIFYTGFIQGFYKKSIKNKENQGTKELS